MLSCPAGDVSMLSGLRDKLQSGRQSLGKRMFKRGQGKAAGASPSKDTLKNTVHVSGPGGASVCLDTAGFASPDAADVAFAAANRYSARGKPSGCHQLPLEPCTPSSLDSSPFLPSLPLPVSVIVCVQEMQDALASSEEEKNALKRQLAKLSKKYAQVTQAAAHTAGIVAGAQAMQRAAEGGGGGSDGEAEEEAAALAAAAAAMGNGHDKDEELEVGTALYCPVVHCTERCFLLLFFSSACLHSPPDCHFLPDCLPCGCPACPVRATTLPAPP
jgi:hypothetical protein